MYAYGFSTRKGGNIQDARVREQFLASLSLDPRRVVLARQVHGNQIAAVDSKDAGREIPDADGLVSKDPSVVLGVRVADCVPLLFVDPKTRVMGVAHAGWRGTLGMIAKNVIEKMKSLGAHAEDVLVFIGPHIGMCCYDVPKERAQRFLDAFGNDPKIASFIEGKWHLDVGYANFLTLVAQGILPAHIHSQITCTSCQVEKFFSYRKDTKDTFGEMMGVMAWKT